MAKKNTSNDDERIVRENIQKRFSNMFSGEHQPLSNMSMQEVEKLKSRITELEAKLAQQSPEESKEALPPARAEVTQVEHPKTGNVNVEESAFSWSRQKQMALWAAGVFTLVGVAFLGFALYILFILQRGQADISDKVLLPLTILMVIGSLTSFRLIQHDRPTLGRWLLYFINVIAPPVLTSLFIANILVLVSAYLIIFALLFVTLVIPKVSRLKAIGAAVVAAFAILAVEMWNPAFRANTNHLETFTPVLIAFTVVAILVHLSRQALTGNIRTKLISIFVAVAVFSMAVVAFLADQSLRSNLTADITESQLSLATSQGAQIGQAIIGQFEKLKGLATVKTIQQGAESAGSVETYPVDTAEIEQLNLDWRAIVAAKDMANPLVIDLLYNPLSTQLRNFQKTFPENVEVLLTDQKGFSIASTNLPTNYYQADSLWWRTAHTTGRYIGQPIFTPATNSVALDIALPVFSYRNGEFVGVLRATVTFNALTDLLMEGSRGQTGYSLIYQPNDQEIKLHALGDGNYEIVQDFASSDLQRFAQSSNTSLDFSLEGIPVLISSAPVRSYSGASLEEGATALEDLGWRVMVVQEKSEALHSVNVQTRNNLILVILVGIAVMIIAYFLARFITNPIIRLNAVAMQIASGDLSVQAKVETRDEVGALAATFNKMTLQLQSLFGSLEQRVQDRTHDLELATEVGRTITEKVANASEMLTAAAELIRTQFQHYYTQVYLTDAAGQKLILRAGTGEVGEELLKRGHRLSLDSNSLNGQAALEKKPIIVADTQQSPNFRPNPLLPKTRSEMAVPLIAGDQVIGVLDMQSEQSGALSESNLPAFQALAGQLAIAIQNAALFEETQRARSAVESQMRRFTEQGWQDFLDAIHNGHRIGFAFNESKVIRLELDELSVRSDANSVQLPITVIGAKIGEIQIPAQPESTLTTSDLELVQSTGLQLAQHIESLRLWAQAERFRQEAEQVTRRLTREGWETYLGDGSKMDTGYIYDLNQVQSLHENNNHGADHSLKQALIVRDETIGELAIDADKNSDEAAKILEAVTQQLSSHLENLRLSELNERQAQREHTLRQITSALRSSTNPETIMRTAVRELGSILGRRTLVQMTPPKQDKPAEPAAQNGNGSSPAVDPLKSA